MQYQVKMQTGPDTFATHTVDGASHREVANKAMETYKGLIVGISPTTACPTCGSTRTSQYAGYLLTCRECGHHFADPAKHETMLGHSIRANRNSHR